MFFERGIGGANALIKWPGEVLGGIVSTVTHPLDALTGAAQSVWSAAGSVAGWAASPIPAQGLERVGDQLLAQSEQQAGELIFDTVSGLITTTIGGVAVKWVGGKWVRAEGSAGAKGSSGAESAINQGRLNSQLLAEEVASRHAFQKHVVERQEFADLGISTKNQFQNFVENIVSKPAIDRRQSVDETMYYLDSSTKTIVIRGQRSEATAFRPDQGGVGWDNYVKSQVPKK